MCGMYALITGNHIAWADPERHVVYHLYSEDVIDEALLTVAQSIRSFAKSKGSLLPEKEAGILSFS